MSRTPRADHELGLMAVIVSITAWGLTSTIIKAIDMDAIAIAFWRFLLYGVLLTAWMYARGGRMSWRVIRVSFPGGLLLAGDVLLFFTAVKLTKVVNATTIGAMQPLVIAGIAARFFGERIQRREMIAALVAIVGVIVVVTQSSGTPEWSGAGDLAAIGALLCWSGYFIYAKHASASLTPLEFTAGAGWWTGIVALVAGFAFSQDMSPPPGEEWPALLLLLFVGGVLGHSMMNWGLPRVPLWLSSVMTLLIPVLASLSAWVWLDEKLTVPQLLAMLVVIGALAVIVTAHTPPPKVAPAERPSDAVA